MPRDIFAARQAAGVAMLILVAGMQEWAALADTEVLTTEDVLWAA